jgi:hypothetical protein
VEIDNHRGTETVFEVGETTGVVDEATTLISQYADRVCQERGYLTND